MARVVSLAQLNRDLWHRAGDAPMLGCNACHDLGWCGSLRIQAPAWSCEDLCCGKPATCNAVCPRNPETYVARRREVGGWDLRTLPRLKATREPFGPGRVPMVYHGARRSGVLEMDYVSVPLRSILSAGGACKLSSMDDVARLFKVKPRLGMLIDCIGFDAALERYWSKGRAAGIVEAFAALRPACVLVPNFSVWNDVPRWDNFHNMKRIAICWHELTTAGVPAALHVNARTDPDWDHWIDFALAREEVQAVSFEFVTGGQYEERRLWQVEQLARLGDACGQRLRLFLRGGARSLPHLEPHFRSVTLVETKQFMKSVKRQKLRTEANGSTTSRPTWTLEGQSLDELFAHNVATMQASIA